MKRVSWFGLCLLLWGTFFASGAEPFSIVLLPDTQFYTDPATNFFHFYTAQTGWIVSNQVAHNIRMVLHEGDHVQTGGVVGNPTNLVKWANASNCMAVLDGVVPYAVVYGNHDYSYNANWTRNTDLFNQHFPLQRMQSVASVVDNYPAGKSDNLGVVFAGGGVDWLVVALEWGPGDAALAWADRLVRRYPRHRVIVLTHCYLYADGLWHGLKAGHVSDPHDVVPPVNNGLEIWEKFVRRHSNIAFVFNGHVSDGRWPLASRRMDYSEFGTPVHQMMANYQSLNAGGSGYLRLLRFDPDTGRISVQTYSPYTKYSLSDTNNQFAVTNRWVFDNTEPPVPLDVQAQALDHQSCRLSWSASEDPESGIASYVVFRGTQQIAIVSSLEFVDGGLLQETEYEYRVRCVNRAGLWSGTSEACVVSTLQDRELPVVTDVWALSATQVCVGFSKPVSEREVLLPGCYSSGNHLAINGLSLASDGRSVILDTGPMTAGQFYPMAIEGLRMGDRALDPGRALRMFEYRAPVLQDDFDDGDADGWLMVDEGTLYAPSSWFVATGRLQQTSLIHGPAYGTIFNRQGTYAAWTGAQSHAWSGYTVEADVETDRDGGVGLLFRYVNTSNYYRFEMDKRNQYRRLFRRRGGQEEMLSWAWEGYAQRTNMHLKIDVLEDTIRVWVDGRDVFGGAVRDPAPITSGTVALWLWRAAPAWFDNVVVRPWRLTPAMTSYAQYALQRWDEDRRVGNPLTDSPGALNPDADTDGDYRHNLDEYMNGGDPFAKVLRAIISTNDAGMTLRWRGEPNVLYNIYFTTNLLEGFERVGSRTSSAYEDQSFLVDPAAVQGYYRIAEETGPPGSPP